MTRQRVVQGPPPSSVSGFPVTVHDDVVYRAARFEPWWFCTCGDCRFDLHGTGTPRQGTLYAGTDPVTGVLEALGPDLAGRPVARTFLARRTVWMLAYDRPVDLADLCSDAAIGFGVTNELSVMIPYTTPQQWAEAFAAEGLDGISYRTRFSTGPAATGIALFDAAGAHDWPKTACCIANSAEIESELAGRHISVEDPPPAAALTLL